MNYYTHEDDTVACVARDSYSYHYPDEDPDGFTGSPDFIRSGRGRKEWTQVDYNDLPTWAQDQFDPEETDCD